jgi:hypothetical protein
LAFVIDTTFEFLPKRFWASRLRPAKTNIRYKWSRNDFSTENQRRPKQKEIVMKTRLKIFTMMLSVLSCFVSLLEINAAPQVTPPPDACYPGFTTAEGCLALQKLGTGTGNTGVGWRSLFSVVDASFNTGIGAGTLALNTADANTAVGAAAMLLNVSGDDNTAVGVSALAFNSGGEDNTAVGSFALSNNDSTKAGLASNNTAVGAEALEFNTDGSPNTAVGYAALNSNLTAGGNTAVGYDALLFNGRLADGFPLGWYNVAVGAGALTSNVDGYSNNAFGTHALFFNINGVANTAVGYYTLWYNDSDARGLANNNTAFGSVALFNNVDGSENTAVGTGAGRNVVTGFNNSYVGDFVGSLAADESDTIRIGDVSNGNGAGSLECYIGGIFNNFQPVGGSVVVVTLDRADDHLGWDFGPSQAGSAPVQRSAPQRRNALGVSPSGPAMINGKFGKVEKLEATVAQQQKEIENLTAQLREQAETFTAKLKEQATQIQRVTAQFEAGKSASRVVNNP